jgi:stress response protein YsnF
MRTVVGLFENANEARLTIAELMESGLSPEEISVLTNVTAQRSIEAAGRTRLHTMQLGDVGRVAACGPLSAALEKAGGPRELVQGLERFGFSPELARHYVSGIEGGATLETVTVDESDADRVATIMRKHAGRTAPPEPPRSETETETRDELLASGGVTTAGQAVASRLESERATDGHADGHAFMEEERTIPVYKEELRVGKREVERGGIYVTTHVTEKPYAERIVLREEHVDIERRDANRLMRPDESEFRETQLEMTEFGEEAVGAKQTRLVEEVIIHKHVSDRTETVGDTLRSTEVDIRKFDAGKYRDYFDKQTLGGTTFEEHVPALRFGEDLRREGRAGAPWEEIEADARARWEAKRPGTFDKFKESIRRAWSRNE